MKMIFRVRAKSGKAVYLQLVDQVRYAAASGALRAGEALPTIRPLAAELRVNRNTVAKAYACLESLGVIKTVAGKGSFLGKEENPLSKQARHKFVETRMDEVVVSAHQMRVGPETLRVLLEERMRFFDLLKAAVEPDAKEEKRISAPASPPSPPPVADDDKGSWTLLTD